MVFGREKPLNKAFFLSIVVVRALSAWGRHPVGCGVWFSELAACGSNFFMGCGTRQVFKGHGKWQSKEESEAT